MPALTQPTSPSRAPERAAAQLADADVVHLPDGDHYRHLHFDRGSRLWVDPFAPAPDADAVAVPRVA